MLTKKHTGKTRNLIILTTSVYSSYYGLRYFFAAGCKKKDTAVKVRSFIVP
jgi:hypothetical protein